MWSTAQSSSCYLILSTVSSATNSLQGTSQAQATCHLAPGLEDAALPQTAMCTVEVVSFHDGGAGIRQRSSTRGSDQRKIRID